MNCAEDKELIRSLWRKHHALLTPGQAATIEYYLEITKECPIKRTRRKVLRDRAINILLHAGGLKNNKRRHYDQQGMRYRLRFDKHSPRRVKIQSANSADLKSAAEGRSRAVSIYTNQRAVQGGLARTEHQPAPALRSRK